MFLLNQSVTYLFEQIDNSSIIDLLRISRKDMTEISTEKRGLHNALKVEKA